VNALFDTHAHLDQLTNVEAALDGARKVGVTGVVAVGTDMVSNEKTLRIAERWPGFVHPAFGLHPSHLGNYDGVCIASELKFIQDNLMAACAVGEVGLDYHKRTLAQVSKETQQKVFSEVLALAAAAQRPVLVHSRYAWADALNLVRESGVANAVFHWFTGFSSVLRGIMDAGYYISATPATEYHEEHRRVVRSVRLEQLLLETDAPVWYGRTEKYQSYPADVLRSLRAVAELRAENEDKVARITTRAARCVLGCTMSQTLEEVS